jgi:uncharacterized surface anchored protein
MESHFKSRQELIDDEKLKRIADIKLQKQKLVEEKKLKEYNIDFTKDRKKIVIKKCVHHDHASNFAELKKANEESKLAARLFEQKEKQRIKKEEADRYLQLKEEKLHLVSHRYLFKEITFHCSREA